MPRLHRLDDLLHGGGIMRVARKHFVAQREAVTGDHQGDADLFAIGAVIARVATLRRADCARASPFEVGARSRRRGAGRSRRRRAPQALATRSASSARLCGSNWIQRAIQPILVHQRIVQLQRIRSAPCADTSPRQCVIRSRAHTSGPRPAPPPSLPRAPLPCRLGYACSARTHRGRYGTPQRERQVHMTELPAAFHPHTFKTARATVCRAWPY